MYHHVKKLMYTVKVGEPDPRFGKMLLEQFGGANGELAAAMQYSIQGFNCEDAARKDLLMDIGTEELSHLEVVGALIRMHLKPLKSSREAAEADPLVAIAGGGGVALFDSMGNAWTSTYLKITGDIAVDLRSNIAAEARAKIVYERLISFTQDAGSKQALQFLMTREITHMRAFTAALESMEKPPFSIGIFEPTPKLVDQFFNASTGESQYGETDFVGPWNHANGLIPVESEVKGGEGLDVEPYDPRPGTEKTSPIDSTPVGEFTNGVGKKQAAIHDKAKAGAKKNATVEV
jgi:Mn-containing catalase